MRWLSPVNGREHKFPFEENSKILGCMMNRQGKTLDAIEERMQSANKAYEKDIAVYRSKDVPWRIKCRRLVDHVYSVFSFGSANWSWTIQTMDRIKKVGGEDNDAIILIQQKERRNMGPVQYKMLQSCQEDMGTDGLTLPV